MKRFTSLLVCLSFICISIFAQDIQITGKVTNADDGTALPGVTVVVKAQEATGTITNINGEYEITAPSDALLVFSFIGMETQEVPIGGQTTIDVALNPGRQQLDEVVVTAFSISKERKALGYAVDDFKSEELERLQVTDATHALQGKAAGVSIASASGSPGASTRVIVRGFSSITQSNQPLYVIDGIPVNNQRAHANSGQVTTSVNRTVDFGNAAGDLNPADIETISILKGAGATSLYGARAANGVILITTKSGSRGDGIKVDFSTSASIEDVGRLPYYQDKFGQGWSGHFDAIENGSWGPELDGADRLFGNTVNNSRRLMPFEFQENGMRDFYEYGYTLNNSLAFSGGNEVANYRFSFTNTAQDGIVPGDADALQRNSINLKASGGTSKTKVTYTANYVNKRISAVATGQGDDAGGGKALYQEILQNPVNHYIPLYRDYESDFDNLDNYYTPYAMNPYFIVNENSSVFKQDRFMSGLHITRELLTNLKISWQGSLDHYANFLKDYGAIAAITPGAPNSSANDVAGLTKEEARKVTQLNSDLFMNYNNEVALGGGMLKYDVMIGHVVNQRRRKRLTSESRGLVVPKYYNIANISGSSNVATRDYLIRNIGLLGQISLNYNDLVHLSFSARNDWSSTLPLDNNSFFYPNVNTSFNFSELLDNKDILSFGKVRISYALAGNSAPPHVLDAVFNVAEIRAGGYGTTDYPVNGVAAYEKNLQLGNPELKNELSTDIEIGTDLRFLNNKIGIDVAYYKRTTTDLIFDANIAPSSGYWIQTTNIGQLTNEGIELKLDLVPVSLSNFRWDLTYIFGTYNTIVDELSEDLGISEYLLNDAYEAEFLAIPGEQLGTYRIPSYMYSPDGKIVVGDNGLPLAGGLRKVGSAIPDYNMSLSNTLAYKGLSFSFLFDFQKGGYMYSYTSSITYWSGNNEQSITNDRRPWVIPNSAQWDAAAGEYVENSVPVHNNWHEYYSSNTNKPIEEERILPRTYLKLREVTLNYQLPDFVQKAKISSASVSLYGRNLFLWTPADNSFIDPEATTWDNDIEGLFGEFGVGPQVRSYGVKLNLSF